MTATTIWVSVFIFMQLLFSKSKKSLDEGIWRLFLENPREYPHKPYIDRN